MTSDGCEAAIAASNIARSSAGGGAFISGSQSVRPGRHSRRGHRPRRNLRRPCGRREQNAVKLCIPARQFVHRIRTPVPASPTDPTRSAVPRLRLAEIRKEFPNVVANDGIDLDVMPGEIHAVLGENGAGKSTLMKIIYGVTRPTAGEIFWEGERVRIDSPAQARALGIGMVFQQFSLFETLTVAQNVALGLSRSQDQRGLASRIRAVSESYGIPVDPDALVHALSVGERQRVEIVRCLLQRPRLLIMDEPTSVLTPQAVRRLFDTLRQLAREGCSILYISHKLDEIRELCHMATVLRAGRVTGHCDPTQETAASLARMMIGADVPVCRHGAANPGGEALLEVCGLSRTSDDPFGTNLRDIRLQVHAGEIVGIAGVSGNGQRELLQALSGEAPGTDADEMRIGGIAAGRAAPGERRRMGLAFVPEERLGRASVPNLPLAHNALLTAHRRHLVRRGLIAFDALARFTAELMRRFDVRGGDADTAAERLSGGNLQKFVVGREILQSPRALIAAQPTAGVDVGAAAFIRQSLIDLRNAGAAVLVVSEELDELFEICDRIAVIAGGRLTPAMPTAQTSIEAIGLAMSSAQPARVEPSHA
jgi:simple sugar transport system ATP-binding protein